MAYNYTAYKGNNDFRGFLAANAPNFLAYTGNDGRIDKNNYLQSKYGPSLTGYSGDQNNSAVYMDAVVNGLYDTWKANNPSPNTTPSTTNAPSNSGASVNANALAQLGQSQDMINASLNRLNPQLDIAKSNIGQQYRQRANELDTSLTNNQNSYNTATVQNQQGFRTNKNTINDQASAGLRGLLRMLGSRGAVGSDLGVAGRAVTDEASAQNAGAGLNYAQNQSNLDTNWNTYQNNLGNERKKLADWQTQQVNAATQQSLTTRQDLLSKLADIQGQISAANGGNYAGGAQSYLDQANALSGRIDALGRFTPTYTGSTPLYTPAALSTYNTTNKAIANLQADPAAVATTPYLNLLLGKDKQKQAQAG